MSKKLTILIVDDIFINHVILESILIAMGHRVHSAKSGRGAIEAVKEQDFDLIFMDINMPDMDGKTATRMIRELPAPKSRIPVVACTADNTKKHIKEYRESGINGIIGKPIVKKELLKALDNYCNDGFHFQKKVSKNLSAGTGIDTKNTAEILNKLLREIGG